MEWVRGAVQDDEEGMAARRASEQADDNFDQPDEDPAEVPFPPPPPPPSQQTHPSCIRQPRTQVSRRRAAAAGHGQHCESTPFSPAHWSIRERQRSRHRAQGCDVSARNLLAARCYLKLPKMHTALRNVPPQHVRWCVVGKAARREGHG